MKKRLLTVLIVLMGLFLTYTSIVCACEGNHNSFYSGFFSPPGDTTDLNTWSMKIKILGRSESIMNIKMIDYAKIKNDPERNKKGIRQILYISMKADEVRTSVILYNDDSKDPGCYTWYREWRRVRRTQFENNKYEDTALTLKEIMDAAVKLIDHDQVTIKDKTVFVLERDIDIKEFPPPVTTHLP